MDTEPFDILVTCDENSKILVSQAINDDSKISLPFSNRYQNSDANKNSLDHWIEFHASTLNRKSNIIIDVMLDSNLAQTPNINVHIEKKGIKLIQYKEFDQAKYGWTILSYGFIFMLILSYVLYRPSR